LFSHWEYWIQRRKENIGYVSKLGAFKPLTEAEKAASLAIEIQSWQASKGTRLDGWHTSSSYSAPLGTGINLKRTREPGGRLDGPEYNKAIDVYVTTPMDHYGILKAQGIDVSKWTKKPTVFHKLFWKIQDWYCSRKDEYYESPDRIRLRKEFIKMFTIKEKK
jgi:hypothetical protein